MYRGLNPERPVLSAARLALGTKFPVDYSAAETLRSIFAVLMETGIRVVVAETMDDVRERSHYRLRELLGKYAFNGTLDDVLKDYKKL